MKKILFLGILFNSNIAFTQEIIFDPKDNHKIRKELKVYLKGVENIDWDYLIKKSSFKEVYKNTTSQARIGFWELLSIDPKTEFLIVYEPNNTFRILNSKNLENEMRLIKKVFRSKSIKVNSCELFEFMPTYIKYKKNECENNIYNVIKQY